MKLIVLLTISLHLNHHQVCAVLPEECYRIDGNRAVYSGLKRTTKDEAECQRWDRQDPEGHSNTDSAYYPDATLSEAENFCRDPDGSGKPWCYTVEPSSRWEYCGIPKCPDTDVKPCPNFSFGCSMYDERVCNKDADCESEGWCCFLKTCDRNICVTPMA